MKPHVLLRLSAASLSVLVLGHTLAILNPRPHGPELDAVVAAMQGYHFDMMGTALTLWDVHLGANWFISAGALVMVVALWQAGTLARSHGAAAQPLAVTLALGAAAFAFLSWRYFFIAPLASCALAALFAGAAALQLGRPQGAAAALKP